VTRLCFADGEASEEVGVVAPTSAIPTVISQAAPSRVDGLAVVPSRVEVATPPVLVPSSAAADVVATGAQGVDAMEETTAVDLSQETSDDPTAALCSAVVMPACATAAATTVREYLEAKLCLPMQTPLLERPQLRRSRTPISSHSLRRSSRIAAKPRAVNATRQAQNVLLRKLGIEVEEEAIDSEIHSKLKAAFHHMTVKKRQRLELLLNGQLGRFDLSALELDMSGLEDDV
jgi:hypothetical protein